MNNLSFYNDQSKDRDRDYFIAFPDILTVKQMQLALNIGKNAAYSLIHNNEIKHIKIGRKIRIPKYCLLDYISKSCYNTDMTTTELPNKKEDKL